jgi:hypothetical protein
MAANAVTPVARDLGAQASLSVQSVFPSKPAAFVIAAKHPQPDRPRNRAKVAERRGGGGGRGLSRCGGAALHRGAPVYPTNGRGSRRTTTQFRG